MDFTINCQVTVTVTNWERFNPRKDVKTSSWFRMSHSLFEDADFFDFTHSDRCFWLYLLSQVSKKNENNVRLNFSHAQTLGHFTLGEVQSALKKLESIQCVHVDVTRTLRARYVPGTRTCSTNSTNGRTNEQHAHVQARTRETDFDLEKLYEGYPRKKGKKRGIELAKKVVNSLDDPNQLAAAVKHFAAYHSACRTEANFIPYFSTWMRDWEDWVDPASALPEGQNNSTISINPIPMEKIV